MATLEENYNLHNVYSHMLHYLQFHVFNYNLEITRRKLTMRHQIQVKTIINNHFEFVAFNLSDLYMYRSKGERNCTVHSPQFNFIRKPLFCV